MSWGAVGGAAIGAIGAGISSSAASGASKSAARHAAKTERARLEFEQQRYEDWKDTYGSIEQNLADYYEALTPTLRTVQGLEAFEKEKDIALTGLRETLAQRGITTSGISAQIETDAAFNSAEERARIRANAPLETAKEQLGFLQVGLGQNPADNVSSALSEQSRTANEIAAGTAQAAGQANRAVVSATSNLASELLNVFTQ